MVGTYDKIKVSKLYSHCMPVQFMHTCLIISLHGVVLFFGDYRIRRQIYVHNVITAKIQNLQCTRHHSTLLWLRGHVVL